MVIEEEGVSVKARMGVNMKPYEAYIFRLTGKYDNCWGDLKFVLVEKNGCIWRPFYDPNTKQTEANEEMKAKPLSFPVYTSQQ